MKQHALMLLRSASRVFLFRPSSFRRRRAQRSRRLIMFAIFLLFIFFVTPFYLVYKPPQWIIRRLQQHWPHVLFHVPTQSKIVALTIDDGPSQYTAEMLQILKENDATATWFIIGGNVPSHEKILEELIQEGHELANHAMRDETSKSLPDDTLRQQIQTVESMIHHAYNAANRDGRGDDDSGLTTSPKYFRPGGGFFSQRMQKVLDSLGYRLILGDIYPHDPFIPYWRVNAWHILSMLHPGGIIICHDKRSWTLPMLRMVLPEIRRRGYRIMTVTSLLQEASR